MTFHNIIFEHRINLLPLMSLPINRFWVEESDSGASLSIQKWVAGTRFFL